MSYSPTAAEVKALRERTGAGMMDCKRALVEAGGDAEKAAEALRIKGIASAAKRGERAASEGVVESYIHHNGKVGVLLEVDCETDFVARNPEFSQFAKDVAQHIAAMNPLYVDETQVPEEDLERERRIFTAEAAESGKPEQVQAKIAEGKLRKWLEGVTLMGQPHFNQDKHEGRTIEELRAQLAANVGENVVVRRFARFQIGG